jgi:RHS repeat-associated protein
MQLGEMSDQGSSSMDLKYYYSNASTGLAPGSSTSLNNGNPTGVLEKAQKGSGTPYNFTQAYGYDPLNRLATASDTGWAQSFSFDRYGNPWQTTAITGLPPDRLPTSNVYTATTNRSGDVGTAYDSGGVGNVGAGNQTTMGSAQLTFDAENRIVQAYDTTTLNSTCFAYDALGERVSKQTFGGNSCTTYPPATAVIYVYDAFGNLMRQVETVTGSGTLPPTPCLTCYLTWDHLGSVRMVSDTVSGGFTAFHDYAPFGAEVLNNAGRTSDWGNGTDYLSQRYTGAERDKETSLDFLQARYLANLQARFMSPDPAGNAVADPTNPQSWNMYGYALNNPLAFVDPDGTDPFPPTCYLEGFQTDCAAAQQLVNSGAASQCPNNQCNTYSQQYGFLQYSAYGNGLSGYVPFSQQPYQIQTTFMGQTSTSYGNIFFQNWDPSMPFPSDPSGLGAGWQKDTGHRAPNDERYVGPGGNKVDWHKGVPGAPRWEGKDHWHWVPGGKKEKPHYKPGDIKKMGVAAGLAGLIEMIIEAAPWAPVLAF